VRAIDAQICRPHDDPCCDAAIIVPAAR